MLAPKTPSWMSDFRKFIMRGNVVDLAVGIIIGAAFTGVVGSLVKDVFNPVLGLLTGGVDFSDIMEQPPPTFRFSTRKQDLGRPGSSQARRND